MIEKYILFHFKIISLSIMIDSFLKGIHQKNRLSIINKIAE